MAIISEIKTIHPDGRVTVEKTIDNDKITVNKRDKLGLDNFVFVFQKVALKVAENTNLGKNAYRILLFLMAEAEFEKEINITLYGIAKRLNIHQANASKSMKELTNLSIVIRNKELKTFRLNYELAFKGSPRNYPKLRFKDEEILTLKPSPQVTIHDVIEEVEQAQEKKKSAKQNQIELKIAKEKYEEIQKIIAEQGE